MCMSFDLYLNQMRKWEKFSKINKLFENNKLKCKQNGFEHKPLKEKNVVLEHQWDLQSKNNLSNRIIDALNVIWRQIIVWW